MAFLNGIIFSIHNLFYGIFQDGILVVYGYVNFYDVLWLFKYNFATYKGIKPL